MEFGFWILDFGFWILDFGFWILDFGSWILDFGFWILDFGFWSLDFGFWILDQFSIRSFCGGPKRRRLDFGFWILDFGVWSLDFGFWILDFGFWILDFGFWILDFGFWILDFGLDEALPDIVWILHKIFPCHADSGRRICFRFARNWNYIDFTYIQHRVLFEVLASAKALNAGNDSSSNMRKFCALDLRD